MAIDKPDVVDGIGTEIATGNVVLTLTDSWTWSDVRSHLLALQSKLNHYFEFIESGQIFEDYPAAHGRRLIIDIITRFSIPPEADEFLRRASEVAQELGVTVRHQVYAGGAPPSDAVPPAT